MQRISTGILGLDKMLKGGLIKGRPYLVMGGPGAGKTIMGFQFLMDGLKANESALYITLDEPYNELRENMALFGWDAKKVRILDLSPESREGADTTTLNYLFDELDRELKGQKHVRVVLDSLTTLQMLEEKPVAARRRVLSLMKMLNEAGCTSMFISEAVDESISMESFLARGVLRIHTSKKTGEKLRAISIDKFRGTAYDEHIRPMHITEKGIHVDEDEVVIDEFD